MGEKAGLSEDQPGHVGEVADRRGVTELGEPGRCRFVAQLGPLAEGEEHLVAACGFAGGRDGENVAGQQVGRLEASGRLREGAVAAVVPAQHGERHEDLR